MVKAGSMVRIAAAVALLVAALGVAACSSAASTSAPSTPARPAITAPSPDATATHEATVLARLTGAEQLGPLIPVYVVGPDWFATGTPTPGTIERADDTWLVVVDANGAPSRLFFMGTGQEFPRSIDRAKDDLKDGVWWREDSDAAPLRAADFVAASRALHQALPSIEATTFVAANEQTSGWLLGRSARGAAAALTWAYGSKAIPSVPTIDLDQLKRAREATGAAIYMFY